MRGMALMLAACLGIFGASADASNRSCAEGKIWLSTDFGDKVLAARLAGASNLSLSEDRVSWVFNRGTFQLESHFVLSGPPGGAVTITGSGDGEAFSTYRTQASRRRGYTRFNLGARTPDFMDITLYANGIAGAPRRIAPAHFRSGRVSMDLRCSGSRLTAVLPGNVVVKFSRVR